MSALSLRTRMAAAYAAAMLAVLVLIGVFAYLYLAGQLSETIETGLRSRSGDLAAVVEADRNGPELSPGTLIESDEGFAQIIAPDGALVASTAASGVGPVLDAAELVDASSGELIVDREIAGVEGEARILARGAGSGDGRAIVVVAASTADRGEALSGLAAAFAIGAPIAILLSSILGYLLAGRSLRPVDAMRQRAEQITLARDDERLPLPEADDEIRHLGETLNRMLDRIEAGLERERVFVADASHELRTPLTTLRAELELAQRPGRSAQELRAAVISAGEEADRLSRLAEDLLVIARADRGGLPIARRETSIGPLLERVVERFGGAAEGRGRIAVAAAPELRASIDPDRIEQALGNCLDNAIRHGGGPVAIRGERAGDRLLLTVSDRGRGIPTGFAAKAFERFSRADEGRTGGGTGLGLAIVRAIALAHGGDAAIEGAPGEGTTVTISLPISG